MHKAIFITGLLIVMSATASACAPGYYCETYASPTTYYNYEAWDSQVKWEYQSQNGSYYSYYGPAYYGTYYNPYGYYNYGYTTYYPSYYQYVPSVYYYQPYYGYYNYNTYYYRPGFSASFVW